VAVDGGQMLSDRERRNRSRRAGTAMSKLTELRGIELTSMINMTGVDHAGAQPLIDFNDLAQQPKLSRPPDPLVAPTTRRPAPQPRPSYQQPSASGLSHLARFDSEHDPYDDGTGVLVNPSPSAPGRPGGYPPPSSTDLVPRHDPSVIHGQAGPSLRERVSAAMAPARRPWLLLVLILLLGLGTAAIIGLSGPTVRSAPVPAGGSTPAPASSGQ